MLENKFKNIGKDVSRRDESSLDSRTLQYITSYNQIAELVSETYRAVFPNRKMKLRIKVLSEGKMYRRFVSNPTASCDSWFFWKKIYARENCELPMLMAIGHEIGHWQKPRFYYSSRFLEEIKGFLFQFKWEDAIIANNIGSYGADISSIRADKRVAGETGFESSSELHHHAYQVAEQIYQKNNRDLDVCFEDIRFLAKSPSNWDIYFP